jgi:hypothetical protein
MHSHLAEANADRSSSRDATRTATIRRLARANEIASTQIVFSTNKLSIRLFFPFVSSSLFRRIFDNRAAPDGPASAPKSDRRFTVSFRQMGVASRRGNCLETGCKRDGYAASVEAREGKASR